MVCIYCGNETNVTNSRLMKASNGVWRRRRCNTCEALFTTEEKANMAASVRVEDHKDTLQPFLRDKLFLSIYKSLGHRKAALDDSTALTRTVIAKAMQAHQAQPGVITRKTLITITHQTLQRFDKPAAIHYAAYHPLV